jgi:hypothetical protein
MRRCIMSQWWGKFDVELGEHRPTKRFLAEIGVLERKKFQVGTFLEVTSRERWDKPYWLLIDDFSSDIEYENFYFTLQFRFSEHPWYRVSPRWEKTYYKIKISYPDMYPSVAPGGSLLYPREIIYESPPHLLGGSFCLFSPFDGRNFGWDPAKHTGATIAFWSIQWVRAYRKHKKTHRWPGDED